MSSVRFRLSADMPSLPLANSQQAANQSVSGVRVRSKIVPAVTEVHFPQPVHLKRPSASPHLRRSLGTRRRLAIATIADSPSSQRQSETESGTLRPISGSACQREGRPWLHAYTNGPVKWRPLRDIYPRSSGLPGQTNAQNIYERALKPVGHPAPKPWLNQAKCDQLSISWPLTKPKCVHGIPVERANTQRLRNRS